MMAHFGFDQLWQAALDIEAESAQWLCQQVQQDASWPARMQTLQKGLPYLPAAALLGTLQAACVQPADLRACLLQADLQVLENLVLGLKALPNPAPDPAGHLLLQTWIDLLEAHFYASAADLPRWADEQALAALQDLQAHCGQALTIARGPEAEGLQLLLRYLNASLILRQLG